MTKDYGMMVVGPSHEAGMVARHLAIMSEGMKVIVVGDQFNELGPIPIIPPKIFELPTRLSHMEPNNRATRRKNQRMNKRKH